MNYADLYTPNRTSVRQAIPGREQDMTANRGGGVSFRLDAWKQLDRFLILGSDSPTFYAGAREMTRDNAGKIMNLIRQDGGRVVARTMEISNAGRAYKNDPALFVLALAITAGDNETKQAVRWALPHVARTGTHLFTFVSMIDKLGGWGHSKVKAVKAWYENKDPRDLAYQITKYAQRNGWSHKDVLRKVHPKGGYAHDVIYDYIMGGNKLLNVEHDGRNFASYLTGVEMVKGAGAREAARLIRQFNLPREVLPSELLKSHEVWSALLQPGENRFMPITAMIRNLGVMTANGFVRPMSDPARVIVDRLTESDVLKKGRVHPLQILAAMLTYRNGRGARGGLTWTPVTDIVDALDEAFYLSFGAVEPTGKRRMQAIDISGSMTWQVLMGIPGLFPREAAAVMSMVAKRTEPSNCITTAFSSGSRAYGWRSGGIEVVDVSPRMRLDTTVDKINGMYASATDCSLPMVWARENKVEVDSFEIYTDNETNSGIHPVQALDQYKSAMGIDATVSVVGMVANGFSIADPNRADMMDFVGFDTATPNVISDFVARRL